MTGKNFHCSIVQIEGIGILIKGHSGSGKTSLALGLMEHASRENMTFALVSDDQAILERRDNCLFASAPKSIKGKVEIRGYGIVEKPVLERTTIGLIVELTPDENIQRMPERETATILNVSLPFIKVPQRHEAAAMRIVFAFLETQC